jgi:YaiO family outer membrane protein
MTTVMELKKQQKYDEAILELDEMLKIEPKNLEALEQIALMLSWTNNFDESIDMWKQASAINPKEPRYKMGAARVLYWNGEHVQSVQMINSVLKEDPKNVEAWILKGDVALAGEVHKVALANYNHAKKLDPNNPEIDKKISSVKIPFDYRFDVGGAKDSFSQVRGDESSYFLQWGKRVNRETDVFVRFENQNQFDSTDQAAGGGIYYKLDKNLLMNADIMLSLKDANFRAQRVINLGFEYLAYNPWTYLLAVRTMNYEQGNVTIYLPGVRWSKNGFTLQFIYGQSTNIDSSKTASYQFKIEYQLFDHTLLSTGYAFGEEALPPLAKAEVKYIPFGIQYQIDDKKSIRLDYVTEDRKNTYIHNTIAASFGYKY